MNEALEYLYSLELFGIKLGLDNIRALLRHAGDPQDAVPAVHVAGTNGKGSVLAMLDAILRASDYRTGRFTSPHLIHVNERFLLNRVPIPDAALNAHILYFRRLAQELAHPPTFFELNTAVAFRWFAEEKAELGLIEVGMGGRLDSTNVVSPVAAAITNVALEHTAYLGDTVEKIAFEKAGIIKPGIPCVVAEEAAGPRSVILDVAARAQAPVVLAGRDFTYSTTGTPLRPLLSYCGPRWAFSAAPLALSGLHQAANAAVAVALAEILQPDYPRITQERVLEGLLTAHWPCRVEKVLETPPVYIDVAHNPAGMMRLAETMPPSIVVLAVSADKDAQAMINHIRPTAAHLVLTQFSNRRAMSVERLMELASGQDVQVEPNLESAVSGAVRRAEETGLPLVFTGSVFLAGEVRQLLVDRYGAKPLVF